MKTSQEWYELIQAKYPDYVILDPDGWDRANYGYSWHEELITKDEFEKRAGVSTCQYPTKMFTDIMNGEFSYA